MPNLERSPKTEVSDFQYFWLGFVFHCLGQRARDVLLEVLLRMKEEERKASSGMRLMEDEVEAPTPREKLNKLAYDVLSDQDFVDRLNEILKMSVRIDKGMSDLSLYKLVASEIVEEYQPLDPQSEILEANYSHRVVSSNTSAFGGLSLKLKQVQGGIEAYARIHIDLIDDGVKTLSHSEITLFSGDNFPAKDAVLNYILGSFFVNLRQQYEVLSIKQPKRS